MHLLILAAALVLGAVPTTAGLLVAHVRDTRVLGLLLVLPGLMAAVVLTLALAQDVTADPPPVPTT